MEKSIVGMVMLGSEVALVSVYMWYTWIKSGNSKALTTLLLWIAQLIYGHFKPYWGYPEFKSPKPLL